MKVLRITNTSDVAIEGVRVEMTLGESRHAVQLLWYHNDAELTDIAPGSAQHIVVGMRARLGVSMPGGGQREYVQAVGYVDPLSPDSTITVRAWSAHGPAATRRFRVVGPAIRQLLDPPALSLPNLAEVD